MVHENGFTPHNIQPSPVHGLPRHQFAMLPRPPPSGIVNETSPANRVRNMNTPLTPTPTSHTRLGMRIHTSEYCTHRRRGCSLRGAIDGVRQTAVEADRSKAVTRHGETCEKLAASRASALSSLIQSERPKGEGERSRERDQREVGRRGSREEQRGGGRGRRQKREG
jgi:hypothetical protein